MVYARTRDGVGVGSFESTPITVVRSTRDRPKIGTRMISECRFVHKRLPQKPVARLTRLSKIVGRRHPRIKQTRRVCHSSENHRFGGRRAKAFITSLPAENYVLTARAVNRRFQSNGSTRI